MSNEINSIDQLLNNYDASQKEKTIIGLDKEERKKKKFKITSDQETFRFMKVDSKDKYFDVAHFHEIKIGKYTQKIYCLKNDGEDCPLCNKYEELINKQHKGKKDSLTPEQLEYNDRLYKQALQFKPKKHFVFEGIDRGAEKEGKKIWVVKENLRKDGVFDKLIPAVRAYNSGYGKDYTDIAEGVDMIITSVQDTIINSKQKYWKVTGINTSGKSTPLHTDENTMQKYLKDKTTWRDLYPKFGINGVIEGADILQLIVEGNAPYWDEDKKTFVFPNRPDLQKKYADLRSEQKEKRNDGVADDVNPIASIMSNKSTSSLDNEDDDFENKLDDIKSKSNFDALSDVEEDFDDLPF
jgi:hypothetical protein